MTGVFPPAIWRPSPKDVAADFNPSILVFGGIPAAPALGVGALFGDIRLSVLSAAVVAAPLPADKVAVITRMTARAGAGAAQTVSEIEFRFLVPDGSGTRLATLGRQDFPAPSAATYSVDFTGGLVMTATELLNITAVFSAAVNPNSVTFGIHGYLIPRGNWQGP